MSKLNPKTLLVIEDDPGIQSQMRWTFDGYEVLLAADRDSAINLLRRHEPPVVTLDLGLPPDPTNASVGLEILDELLKLAPHTKIIVVTGNDDRDNAVRAISLGAYDFYQKPIDPDILKLIVERGFHLHELEVENRRLALQRSASPLEGVIAASPQMLKVCRLVEKVAPTDVTTLLLGESGTGKEILARALHDLSLRNKGPFVAINSAAIPETLLESELFGYERGAFTGANKQTLGRIEYANGGTFFLDEVGDLPMALQAKMLRFLQERIIERIGGRKEIPVDVRVVCATHQDLPRLIEAGRFREDLYYRISEVQITIPPVRDREGDAMLLARAFLNKFSAQNRRSFSGGFSNDALQAINAHEWPGNVREMENKVKRAVIMAEGSQVTAEDLELSIPADGRKHEFFNLRQVRDDAERSAIVYALSMSENHISQAAELLGVSRPTLYDLMKKHGIK